MPKGMFPYKGLAQVLGATAEQFLVFSFSQLVLQQTEAFHILVACSSGFQSHTCHCSVFRFERFLFHTPKLNSESCPIIDCSFYNKLHVQGDVYQELLQLLAQICAHVFANQAGLSCLSLFSVCFDICIGHVKVVCQAKPECSAQELS